MSEIQRDRTLWHAAWLDTPFATPKPGLTHDAALQTPGCFIKSRKRGADNHPEMLGRLVSIKDGRVIVRSNEPYHDGKGQPFVWSGTLPEYLATWRCD